MLRERIIEVDGKALCIGEGPDHGPPLVLFHGVTRRWQTWLPLLPALTLRYHVFAVDHPGHGGSDWTTHGYRVTDYVRYAERLLRTPPFSTTREFVLYGHSLGAMVVAELAARFGNKVKAAVLEDPPFDTMGTRLAGSPLLGYFEGLLGFTGRTEPLSVLTRELAELRTVDPVTGHSGRLGDVRDAGALRFTARSLSLLDPEVLRQILDGGWTAGFDWQQTLRGIAAPVLLLQGDTTAGGMLVDEEAALAETLAPDLWRVKFPGSGHLLHWQRTDALLRCMQAFLE